MRRTITTETLTARSHFPSGALAVLGCVVAIAACGSGHSKTATASDHFDQGVKFAACMRSHGLTNFPDPSSGGGGIQIKSGSGINPFSPAFKTAQTACKKLLPGPLGGNQHPTAQAIAQTRQIAVCMRQHGVTGFPDPTFTPPSSPAGYSIIEDRGGVVLAVPSTINPRSPEFMQAAKVCHFS
jgi:hypothetical protein